MRRNLSRTRGRYESGFTLVEIMLALTLTGLIAGATTSMLFSVAAATTTQSEIRHTTVKEKVIGLRMNDAISSSKTVLAQGADYLVLWMGDQRMNGVPDLSEIRRIERDDPTDQLMSYRAPFSLPDVDNATYMFTDNFNAITTAMKGSADFPGELWGTNVTAWTQTLDQSNAQSARLVSYRLTITNNDVTGTAAGTLSLKSR